MITSADLESARNQLIIQLSLIEGRVSYLREQVAGKAERQSVLNSIIRVQEHIRELEKKITEVTNNLQDKRRGPLDKGTIEVEE